MKYWIFLSTLIMFSASAFAQLNPCDLNSDGAVDGTDLQYAAQMAIGARACSANIYGTGVCNAVVVQRVANAANGGACLTGTTNSHQVTLNWTASASSGVLGYNVYRATVVGGVVGSYGKINAALVTGTGYTDTAVTAGTTYSYVATSVNATAESPYSGPPASTTVPTP